MAESDLLAIRRSFNICCNVVNVNPETKIELQACDLIYGNLGVESLKLNVKANTGYPDRVFWVPGGKPLFIEFKTPDGELSEKQKYHIDRLRKDGYNVEVCDNAIDAFHAAIKAVEATRLSEEGRQILARARKKLSLLLQKRVV